MKSSILYLHSLTVRPMEIVRLSRDPLIQDSTATAPPLEMGSPRAGASLGALYIVGEGGQPNQAPGASLSLSLNLAKPCRDHRCFHHHAVVLLDLHQPLLPPCWIKKEETSLPTVRVLNAEVPSVRH